MSVKGGSSRVVEAGKKDRRSHLQSRPTSFERPDQFSWDGNRATSLQGLAATLSDVASLMSKALKKGKLRKSLPGSDIGEACKLLATAAVSSFHMICKPRMEVRTPFLKKGHTFSKM
jgi:hypothetical protein